MAVPARGKPEDTTLYRIAKNVGFNARVEPIWHTYSRLESRLGFFDRWRERRLLRRRIGAVNGGLRAVKILPDGWDAKTGDCVCNLRVAKLGLVSELKSYLRNVLDAEVAEGWTHLMALRDGGAWLIPPDFPRPVMTGPEAFPVASAARLREELRAVNDRLRIEETFAIRKMVDFLDATERDISMYESKFGTYEGFWAKFSYVLLRKLADASAQHGLPVIFA